MIKFNGNEQFNIRIAEQLIEIGLIDVTDSIDKKKGKLLLSYNDFEIYFDYINIYYRDNNIQVIIKEFYLFDTVSKIVELNKKYDKDLINILK